MVAERRKFDLWTFHRNNFSCNRGTLACARSLIFNKVTRDQLVTSVSQSGRDSEFCVY